MAKEVYAIRVYRTSEVFEYDVEVDSDVFDAENSTTAREDALRQAVRRAMTGEGGSPVGGAHGDEYVALVWDETNRLSATVISEQLN